LPLQCLLMGLIVVCRECGSIAAAALPGGVRAASGEGAEDRRSRSDGAAGQKAESAGGDGAEEVPSAPILGAALRRDGRRGGRWQPAAGGHASALVARPLRA